MNETLKIIESRFSSRKYTDQQVEQEKLEAIVNAALRSPSGLNKQPWKLVVVQDKELIDEIDVHGLEVMKSWENQTAYERMIERGGKPYYNANVMFFILKEENAGDLADFDCGIMAQTIAIAAKSLGLDSVIAALAGVVFDGPRADEFKGKINWPAGHEFGLAVLVGYGDMTNPERPIDTSKVQYVK